MVRTNVPVHNDATWSSDTNAIASIKNFITNVWTSSPATNLPKAILLIGHVPIPHSGWLNPDGHFTRCLPADGFYGDVDGTVTDNSINYTAYNDGRVDHIRHDNYIGDGKWDQNQWPGNGLEIAVGRIDCARMPSFWDLDSKDETTLLRQYLNKDDQYRRKVFTFQSRVMTATYMHNLNQFADVVQWGMRTGSRLFGFAPESIINGDGIYPENGCTWAVDTGYGEPWHMEGSNYVLGLSS